MYLEREAYISVSVGEDLTKIREVEQREQQLQNIVNGLLAENMSLKAKLEDLAKDVEALKRVVQQQLAA
jgi:dynactin complex subunit